MSLRGGGAKKDYAATAEAKRTKRFRCKNSFIDLHGREFLASGDWSRRVKEMFERDGFKCRAVTGSTNSDFCCRPAVHPHHQKHRGDGGDDSLGNLISLCAFHHSQMHPEKQTQLRSIPQ
jgi:predicted restriction endonuclease